MVGSPSRAGDCLAGRYALGGELGRGAASIVFEATDLTTGQPVALKLLRSDAVHPSLSKRFLREARLAASIDHGSVVRILDSGVAEGVPYLVMERVAGRDLGRFLREQGELPLPLAIELGVELCGALSIVHGAGVLHRDVKPANVLVRDATTGPRLKLLDFGLARVQETSADELTREGEVLGSLPYLAPELLFDATRADAASDVYALVCVLHDLLFGRPPFVAESRAALRQAIRFDEPSLPRVRDARLHARLTALFRRGLAKDPTRRFASASALRDELEALELPLATRQLAPEPTAGIPERFRVERRLGAGAHGEVFAVYDRVLERDLALKRLRGSGPEAIARLKREFEALRGITSPHLVQVEQLFEDGDSAFFTMHLVHGHRLSDMDAARLDAVGLLGDLATGLGALHARGLVHRDLKPSNVLIEPGGRAVIVDLGLALTHGERGAVAGTPPYMAPELLDGKIGKAADAYALGVLVFELLLGRERAREALSVAADSAALLTAARDAPPSLVELCLELVRADPDQRPNMFSVLERLQSIEQRSERASTEPARASFVGREGELAELEDAWRASARRPLVVLVEGEAGIGKSALVEHFARQIGARRETLLLEARCHHAESVPLPALDAAIEQLASALAHEQPSFLESVTPRDVRALLRFLPALQRVPWPGRRSEASAPYSDPSELRSQAIDALRELLDRISDRRGILLTLDDTQWLDADSASVLRAIVGATRAPRLLVVLTRRSPEGEQQAAHPFLGLHAECRHLSLGPLPPADTVTLARQIAAVPLPTHESDAHALLEQTRGNPYLISLFVGRADLERPVTTSEALLAEYRLLELPAQRVLELVALSPRPLATRTLLHAAGSERNVLAALEKKRLIRAGGGQIEVYHALVAEGVAAALDAETRARRHAALAAALQRFEPDDERALVEHLAAAGDFPGAVRIAVHAAQHARDSLAFDSAATLLETALRYAHPDAPERSFLLEELSRVLAEAGRNHDAADALLAASERLPERRASLRQRAGELLLQSGDVKQGLDVLTSALEAHGLALASPDAALAEAFGLFGALLGRGLTYTPRTAPECSADALQRIDLCLSLAHSLTYVDLRFLGFLLRGLSLALDAGEPVRLLRALALFVAGTASHLPNPLVRPAFELCRSLCAEFGNAEANVSLLVAEAELAHFEGNFLAAELHCEKAERVLLESCTGAARQLADVRIRSLLIQYSQKGDYQSIFPRSSSWLLEADARQDRFYANWLRAAHGLVWVARDKPEKARAELARAEADWPGGAGVFEIAVALYLDVIDRYEGLPQAIGRAAQGRAAVLGSPASQTPFLQGYLWLHRGWGALRTLARAGQGREDVELAVTRLRGLGLKIWQGTADVVAANLAFIDGRREEAIALLEHGELALRELNLLSLAACARKRRGEFTAGALGARLKSEADAQLSELGVASPDRFAAAYFGPFAVGGSSAESATMTGNLRVEA